MADDELHAKPRAKILNRMAERLGLPHRLDRMADKGDEQQLLCLIVEAITERLEDQDQPAAPAG